MQEVLIACSHSTQCEVVVAVLGGDLVGYNLGRGWRGIYDVEVRHCLDLKVDFALVFASVQVARHEMHLAVVLPGSTAVSYAVGAYVLLWLITLFLDVPVLVQHGCHKKDHQLARKSNMVFWNTYAGSASGLKAAL